MKRLKSNFINAASHELRTPLSSIIGFAEFLEDHLAGPLTEQQQGFVHEIQHGAGRLMELVDDLLDFARMEAGTFKLEVGKAELSTVTKRAIASLEPQLQERQLSLNTRLPVSPVEAIVDSRRVEQILLNLLGNAIKFTEPRGKIAVRLTVKPTEARWEIHDTGIGISAENLPHVFEKFFQVDASSTREQGGTGLGLAIARALVEAHGGAIGAESTPGKGTTFWFTLPIAPAPAAPSE
jgi:signal transduction histidine kinase